MRNAAQKNFGVCRGCGQPMLHQGLVDGQSYPTAGDIIICEECNTVSVYGDNMVPRDPNPGEWADMRGMPELAPFLPEKMN